MTGQSRSGGRVLVDQLLIHGTDTVFCVPGESYLAATDALYDVQDAIDLIVCRQEGGAAHAAEAYGKLTGRPGICFVTRGPGATNASIGVHTAFQDSTPLILFVGQVSTAHLHREGFQELDYAAVFGSMAKWAVQIDRADRIPELVRRAFQVATSGRPGPVVIALPEDVLSDVVEVADVPRYQPARPRPAASTVDAVARELRAAVAPVIVAGGSGWTSVATDALRSVAEGWQLPVITSFRRQDLIDNDSASFIGALGPAAPPSAIQALHEADLILLLGTRLGEMSSNGFSVLEAPEPRQRIIHVYPDPEELGRLYVPDLAIVSDAGELVLELSAVVAPSTPAWAERTRQRRAGQVAHATPPLFDGPGVDMAAVVAHLTETVPSNTVITNGAGNYTAWAHRFHRFHQFPSQLGPTSGAMGYGLPAALAASLLDRDRLAVVFAGDGCMLMNGQELATAMRYELPILVIVVNNGHYGTIRLHQEKRYPGRVHGTGLSNPDFVAFAESFGAYAERVTETQQFPAALARAREAGRTALIEIITDPDVAVPGLTLTAVRSAAMVSVGTPEGVSS